MSEESASDAGPGAPREGGPGVAPATGSGSTGAASSARNDDREPPPILGSWSRVYAVVVAELAVVIALLYLLTRRFS